MKKKVAVLGASGSIGKSSLDVISRSSSGFEPVLLSAFSSRQQLEQLSKQYPKAACVLCGEENGGEKLLAAIKAVQPDITINGISGACGLLPSLAAIEAGSDLALANKETIVMAGNLVLRLAKEKNVNIIPVDSEHSAIFNLIQAHGSEAIEEIILTASGGPFRNFTLKEMENIKPQDALDHPTWKMGPKITIDSATMANKGLEIIEACALFNMKEEKVKVVIHPQSVVHSMVRMRSGVIYAQLSKPDMRHPIHDALHWPKTAPSGLESLNFDSLTLEFQKPDCEKFPMLSLAWEAAEKGGLYPCAYNAANEEAVSAFINKQIGFLDIAKTAAHVLESDWPADYSDVQTVLKADAEARKKAVSHISKMCHNT